jgi:hypothetical protein
MKKIILAFAIIGFVTMAATTSSKTTVNTKLTTEEKYKACIDACNKCIVSCKKVQGMHSKKDDAQMTKCIELCKACIVDCTAAVKLMKADSPEAKAMCLTCAKTCEACALECDRQNSETAKICATDCRQAAKMCHEM